ncbi:MAG: asparagine synthase (glutamine-hydrolyzing) [Magnetococcales bacterium]|nr:asparagine synthase (glutamine-hydrolyzing) [Magnetococcales bacterium]
MCGIAGWFGPTPDRSYPANHILRAMMHTIRHRGPDGDGIHLNDNVALGHVRLSIIDPESGQQPMWDHHRRAVISYNGEVYNFPELRTDLIQRGVTLRTRTDTEVLLGLFLEHGIDAIAKASGMYALALWDPHTETGYLVRDRQGIKPLFYCIEGERLLFASEAKGLLPARKNPPEMEVDALHLLLNFRYLPGDLTLFRGVRQMMPGEVLIWREGAVTAHTLPGYTSHIDHSHPAEDGDHFRDLLSHAVQRHMISDVPLGIYLSAGLDSGAIASIVKTLPGQGADTPTFTLDAGDRSDEAQGAKETATILGMDNITAPLPNGFEERLHHIVHHLEVPKVNAFQTDAIAELTSGHVKVALSGLGGDESFLGYTVHRFLWWQAMISRRPLSWMAKGFSGLVCSLWPDSAPWSLDEVRRGSCMVAALDSPRAYGILRNVWDSPEWRQRLYGPRMRDHALTQAFEWLDGAWPHNQPDYFTQATTFETRHKLVNDFLWQEDRMSMAHGLEVRTPFLDEQLVASVSQIPWQERIPRGHPKAWMRTLLTPLLDRRILQRPKSGFQVNASTFHTTHLKPLVADYLASGRFRESGLFNPAFARQLIETPPTQKLRWHYFMLYLMVGTLVWSDVFERNAINWHSLSHTTRNS